MLQNGAHNMMFDKMIVYVLGWLFTLCATLQLPDTMPPRKRPAAPPSSVVGIASPKFTSLLPGAAQCPKPSGGKKSSDRALPQGATKSGHLSRAASRSRRPDARSSLDSCAGSARRGTGTFASMESEEGSLDDGNRVGDPDQVFPVQGRY